MKKKPEKKANVPWKSPVILWSLCGFCLALFLMGQMVTVIPNERSDIDAIIWNVVTLTAGFIAGAQALRLKKKGNS